MATLTTTITITTFLTAVGGLFAVILKVHKWYLRQEQQDKDIKAIKKEQSLMYLGIVACLDGLQQMGCNHTVPDTKQKLEDYINEQAHQ